MNEKKLSKVKKILNSAIDDMDGLNELELQKLVCSSQESIAQATDELHKNENYQAAKENLKELGAGLRDVKKYQGAKIAYALYRLKGLRGELTEE